jgi:hypothetical protein
MRIMPEEQAQGQQTIEKAEKAEKVDMMQESQELEKKRAVRPVKAAPAQALSPSANRSYWPFALALMISIALMGVVFYPIIFFIGLFLTVVIIIAWGVERR